jgi:hypothetical protein
MALEPGIISSSFLGDDVSSYGSRNPVSQARLRMKDKSCLLVNLKTSTRVVSTLIGFFPRSEWNW